MGIRSGSHGVDQYSVTRDIVVTINYDLNDVSRGTVGESPNNRMISPVTVELRSAKGKQ